jgi:ribosome assembly protein RRB1
VHYFCILSMSGFSKKRSGEGSGKASKRGAGSAPDAEEEDTGGLVFEDPFYDEIEPEEYDENAIERDDVDYNAELEGEGADKMEEEEDEGDDTGAKQVWRPGVDRLEEGETLDYDPSAYIMYHSMTAEWPCLSFDFMRDGLGDGRQRFPLTMFMCMGSQADKADNNKITLVKLSELHKTGGVIDSDDDDDDDVEEDPTIEHINIPHNGGINRIRSMPQSPGIIATMADNAKAYIYDAQATFKTMSEGRGPRAPPPTKPAYTFKGHKEEGYALAWSNVEAGQLATGDCAGAIHVWNKGSNANCSDWRISPKPFLGHTDSVEDIQWSPGEKTVFASASVDRTVRIWDTRGQSGPQITVNAHNDDVNVISWSSSVGYLLASGCDDGSFKVWDLRSIRKQEPLANFTYHKQAITSIEWAPHDESVLCVSSADDQTTVWDLSVEADESDTGSADLSEFPAQLLFIHQGQKNVKEAHWHPQIPNAIVTTAEDGLNVFKPAISVTN